MARVGEELYLCACAESLLGTKGDFIPEQLACCAAGKQLESAAVCLHMFGYLEFSIGAAGMQG